MKLLRKYVCLALFIALAGKLFSVEYADTKGRDFWLTFLPNSHKTASLLSSDSLYVFITAEVPCSGKIEYYDRAGRYYFADFDIYVPQTPLTFKFQYYDYELWGYRTEGSEGTRFGSEQITPLSFHITCDQEISVYAHSQAKQTSDAFLVMPTDVLDKDYMIASYTSDGSRTGSGGNGPTPSQFAIVATENMTKVAIVPKCQTEYFGLATQNILLNKGDVYLVQAKIDAGNTDLDLTGSEIHADKKVAVFAGHQKAFVPKSGFGSTGSRDCLIEQMPPISVLGKNAFITPFKQPRDATASNDDLYRIIAVSDSTEIFINNTSVAILDKGEFYENSISQAATVSSKSSFMLVKYKKTSDLMGGTRSGDPFMLVVPPKEQFMNSYKTINVQASEGGVKVYDEQYISIVIPTLGISSLRIDGNPVNASQFIAIPNSTYSYASISVSDGVHTSSADSAFGIYIYGYGTANSFGYTGGMSFKPLDYLEPQIAFVDSCYSVTGMVYDSLNGDTGILTIESPDSLKKNCDVLLDKISGDKKSASFSAKLIDKRQDGFFTIICSDSMNHTNRKTLEIKGFTLAFNGNELSGNIIEFKSNIKGNETKCFKIPVHNYGKFTQTISKYKLVRNSFVAINPVPPLQIKPGQIDTITVCITVPNDSLFSDTLLIIDDCGESGYLARFKIQTGSDKSPPRFLSFGDTCSPNRIYEISDSTEWDSGIASIDIISRNNCNIDLIKNLPISVRIQISIVNPDEEMYYSILVTDSAGNKIFLSDTVVGGRISFFSSFAPSDTIPVLRFGKRTIGTISKDSIYIYNSGNKDITLNGIHLARNVEFSVPKAQFPLLLKAKDSTKLFIYYNPLNTDITGNWDTLLINSYCLNQKMILNGFGISNLYSSESDCDIGLSFKSSNISKSFFLSGLTPNPANEAGKVSFGTDQSGIVQLDVLSSNGELIINLVNTELASGIYERAINTSELSAGIYFIRLNANGKQAVKSIIVE